MMRPDLHHRAQVVEELFRELLSRLPSLTRRPSATYRFQFNKGFGFKDAIALLPYLKALGISDVYASPYLKAAPGSPHGYDVVDHNTLNPELGTPEDHQAFVEALARHGMGHILDYVPNHMAIGSENPYWMDVLENGPSSIHAHLFDIDWRPVKEELNNRVLVPLLGDQYGAVLEKGELKLSFEAGAFWLRYYDHRFPIAPRQYGQILKHRLPELEKQLGKDDIQLQDFLSIITHLEKLPPRSETDPAKIVERNREKEAIKRRLVALCEASAPVRAFLEENVRLFNGTPGEPRSFDLLDALLREQAYRLAYWRVAAEEINYRRFFDINSLAAIRMEDPRVMAQAHALVFQLIGEGKLQGLRIDHPDGLYHPAGYFERLQEEFVVALGRRFFLERAEKDPSLLKNPETGEDLTPAAAFALLEEELRARHRQEVKKGPASPLFRPLYVVVEKILGHGEQMPERWPVHGTTGYDFMNLVNGLFVDERAAREIDDIFTRFVGVKLDYQELVYQKKRQIMADSLSSEMNVLARQLNRISELDRRTRDFTLNSLKRALIEVVACFPVYRTYVAEAGTTPDEHDVKYVESAIQKARKRNPTINASIFHFIRDVLLLRVDAGVSQEAREARLAFVLKLQQVTAPVMAKGVEDTTFYIYNRLISLNEVGGEPYVFGTRLEAFHRECARLARVWPFSLNATSTHDTKRSEDVRTRIDVLSEQPGEWRRRLALWARLNRKHKVQVGDRLAPDRNEELLLYQVLLGTFPFEGIAGVTPEYRGRIVAYLQKALKEAKVNTSWLNPDEEWDKAVTSFIEKVLDPVESVRFLEDVAEFHQVIARAGAFNSLTQVLVKTLAPGVPDLYQGNELWDFSLVDPDNRRPVDYARRQEALQALDKALEFGRRPLAQELVQHLPDGRIKLFVTREGLRLRQSARELFEQGEYLALATSGERARHLVAFARRHQDEAVVCLAPRFTTPLLEREPTLSGEAAWADTVVELPFDEPGTEYVDLFTGTLHEVALVNGKLGLSAARLFSGFPLVLLVSPQRFEALTQEPAEREEEPVRAATSEEEKEEEDRNEDQDDQEDDLGDLGDLDEDLDEDEDEDEPGPEPEEHPGM